MTEAEDPTPRPGIRVLGQSTPAPETPEPTSAAPAEGADNPGPGPTVRPEGADAPEPAATSGATGPTVRPGVLLALMSIAILGVAGTLTFGLLWSHDQSQQSGAKSVETASRAAALRFLKDFTTFSPSTVAQTFSDIQALSTGSFASQAKAEFSASLRQQLQAADASTAGQVRYLELQSYGADSASYFADVVQTFSNDKTSGPQSDELRLVVGLTRVHGQWKVSGVTSLDTPAASGG